MTSGEESDNLGLMISTEDSPTSGTVIKGDVVMVPQMTAEEVAQRRASRGKLMVPVRPPKNVGPQDFKNTIGVTYMLYLQYGDIPTPAAVAHALGDNSIGTVIKIMESPEFALAMRIRGVEVDERSGLTAEQDMAIAIMSAPDGQPFLNKLKKAGVAPSTWRAWLKNKKFRAVWDSIGATVLTDHETDMLTALAGQAVNGDVQAIKYAFEVSGRYAPARTQSVDATILISQMIEIIQEEVKDTETLQRIAARMQMVGSQPSARAVLEQGMREIGG